MKEYDNEKRRLANDLETIGVKKRDVLTDIAGIIRAIRNFHNLYGICNVEDKGKLLKTQVDMIFVHEDYVEIVWNEAWKIILDPDILRYKNYNKLPIIKSKAVLQGEHSSRTKYLMIFCSIS